MGPVNWLAVALAALAAFATGAVWYGILFPKSWQKAAGISPAKTRNPPSPVMIYGLTLALEFIMVGGIGIN